MIEKTIHLTYKVARRIAIAVVGTTVLIIGIVMIIAPGPAIVVIPIGLAILLSVDETRGQQAARA